MAAKKWNKPFKGLGLEHMNNPSPVIPSQLTNSIMRSIDFQSYQLAEDLGRAFSDRAILQTFVEAETTLTDAPLKSILGLLRSMYALVTLEELFAFLRYGYLSIDNAAVVRKEVAKLCEELRPHALSLVSSPAPLEFLMLF